MLFLKKINSLHCQIASIQDPYFLVVTVLCNPLPDYIRIGPCDWWHTDGRNGGMSLVRLSYEGHCGFVLVTLSCSSISVSLSLSLSFSSLALGEARCLSPMKRTHPLQASLLDPPIWFHRGESTKREEKKKSSTSSPSLPTWLLITTSLSPNCF